MSVLNSWDIGFFSFPKQEKVIMTLMAFMMNQVFKLARRLRMIVRD